MKPRTALPHITDSPKAAFLSGWWAGLGVGFINGVALLVILAKS